MEGFFQEAKGFLSFIIIIIWGGVHKMADCSPKNGGVFCFILPCQALTICFLSAATISIHSGLLGHKNFGRLCPICRVQIDFLIRGPFPVNTMNEQSAATSVPLISDASKVNESEWKSWTFEFWQSAPKYRWISAKGVTNQLIYSLFRLSHTFLCKSGNKVHSTPSEYRLECLAS